MLPGAICGWILSLFPSILGALWRGVSLPASRQPAFPLPGSHTAAAEDVRKTVISPNQTPEDTGRTASDGDTPEPSHAQPWQEGTVPARQLVWVLRHLFVCLFVCHWATERMEKNINVILSPMSHRSARAEMPHSSHCRARGSRGRAQGTPKAAHPGSCCLPDPALTPSPSPELGTPVAWGHRRPRDNFPGPGKRRRNLHLYLHFLIAPAGFLGQRQALVSMAGFVRTPRTEGGTKGPQWTCHSPASKAAGGAGRGHRSRGHRSLPPPSTANTGADAGSPPGRGRGWSVADTLRTLVVSALLEQRWGHDAGGAARRRSRVSTAITRRWQPPRARRKWCKSRTQMFPLFLFPVIFSRLSIQLGWVSFPFQLPYSI